MPSKDIMPPSTSNYSHHSNPIHNQQNNAQSESHIQPDPLELQDRQPKPQIKTDFVSVEELVHEIKENLRLKARPASHQLRSSRPSPYHIPCRSWNDQQQPNQLQQQQSFVINNSNCNTMCTECNNLNSNYLSSSDKNLECQACKIYSSQQNQQQFNYQQRFQHLNQKKDQDIDDPYELLQKLLKSKNLVKEAVRRLQLNNISPKQRSYFYESDEESHSPMFRVCQLEL